ncbi:hypothetical protein [Chitinophaga sp. XS-30]|uniref:hypothetical protein n=1 Tax=Chitinophaga sp. XS-30 TaxID=2604421 RepID=UPI0011DD3216|nr:hypothetical protein [Chitinophaga sp. XS-30]QEH43811.1 hypothetical protein FW415_24400 [Chitinophaga sp. XS-30]
MTKPFLLLLAFAFTQLSVKAQSDCDELKKENEYLKKAIKFTTPTKTLTSSKIDFNLIKVEGNTKEQSVDIVLTLTNRDVNKNINLSKAVAIDIEANEYETYNTKIGSGGSRNKIYTDTPVKTVIRFTKILPGVKMLKLVPISYYDESGNTVGIEFKDLTIDWK